MLSEELKMIALLSNPYEEVAFDSKDFLGVDINQILNLLEKNKISLTCYENILRFPQRYNQFNPLFMLIKKTLNDNKRLIINVDQKIMELNELFKKYDIEFLLPKYTYFHREHNDIDVLVLPEEFELTLKILKSHDYVPTSVQSRWKVTTTKWIDGRRSAIHVHSILHWQFEFIQSENIRERSILIDFNDSVKLRVPCGEDSILITAAHAIFENKKISLSDLFQLIGILRKFPAVNWYQIFDISYKNGWSSDLLFFLEQINYLSFFINSTILIPKDFFIYGRKRISIFDRIVTKLVTTLTKREFCNVPYVYSNFQSRISIIRLVFQKPRFFSISRFLYGLVKNKIHGIKQNK
ncbi:nucleotidyltransferase family protein [Candidatus Dojkabacteria bacterium]|nr:nucleotidyltransferase family protein [Candidatus Dojkabacteria bacterium]